MPEIDRLSKGPGDHFRGQLLVTLIASAIVISLFMTVLITPAPSEGDPPASNVPAHLSYIVHSTILINGNSQFTNASGVVWGSGTASDPYIMDGWDINASSSDGIAILNSTVHFIVRDSYIHDGSHNYDGILLYNCSNGVLESNTCSNNFVGILLDSSSSNTLSNNTCSSNNYHGISLGASSSNTLSNNTCSSNNWYGISLGASSSNTLSNNTCSSNNCDGISIHGYSNSNTLSNNTCSSNDYEGIFLEFSCSNNTLSNNICSNNSWGIDIWSSSNNNTLSNNNCSSNDYYGICLYDSSSNTLSNNTCSSNNGRGIILIDSNNNTLIRSQLCDNWGYGVYISSGSGNRIWNNTFIGNNGAGSVYDVNHIQARDNGTDNRWNSSGTPYGYGNHWGDWTTPDSVAPWGIVDNPYDLEGSAGAKDYFPLALYDFDPPMTTVSLSGTFGSNGWYKSPVTVFLHAADNVSGINETFCRIGTSGSWSNYSSSFVLSSEGSSTVQFYSRDNASNNETVKSIIVKIDKTSPFGTIVVQGGATFATVTLVILNLSASDSLSGVEQFRCSNDGVTWGSWESWQNLSPYSWNLQIGDGLKTIFFQIMDNASNTATYNDTIILDTIPPTLTFGVASGVKFTGSSATINWSATDVNGIVSYEYSLDGRAFVSCGLMTHIDLSNLTAGSHNLTIRAIDVAGNGIDRTIRFNTETVAGISGDLVLYGGIAAIIILVIIATLVMMRKKKGS